MGFRSRLELQIMCARSLLGLETQSETGSDRDVGKLVRWAMKDMVRGQEPSPRVWQQIAAHLRQGPPPRAAASRRPILAASAVLAAALVLALGVRNWRGPDMALPEQPPALTASVAEAIAEEAPVVSSTGLGGHPLAVAQSAPALAPAPRAEWIILETGAVELNEVGEQALGPLAIVVLPFEAQTPPTPERSRPGLPARDNTYIVLDFRPEMPDLPPTLTIARFQRAKTPSSPAVDDSAVHHDAI